MRIDKFVYANYNIPRLWATNRRPQIASMSEVVYSVDVAISLYTILHK